MGLPFTECFKSSVVRELGYAVYGGNVRIENNGPIPTILDGEVLGNELDSKQNSPALS